MESLFRVNLQCNTPQINIFYDQSFPRWLLDAVKDPDELYNFYKKEGYEEISQKMQEALIDVLQKENFRMWERGASVYLNTPKCLEGFDQLKGAHKYTTCQDYGRQRLAGQCNSAELMELCPYTCGSCKEDSDGQMLFLKKFITCSDQVQSSPHTWCADEKVRIFCPNSCSGLMS